MAKLRYVRVGDCLDDDAETVVRGGLLVPEAIRRDALRMHSVYAIYGISVFAVSDATLDEVAQQPPLVRFVSLTLMTVGAIQSVGLRIEPTGRNPRHYTIAFDDLDRDVARLCAIEHESTKNPYYED